MKTIVRPVVKGGTRTEFPNCIDYVAFEYNETRIVGQPDIDMSFPMPSVTAKTAYIYWKTGNVCNKFTSHGIGFGIWNYREPLLFAAAHAAVDSPVKVYVNASWGYDDAETALADVNCAYIVANAHWFANSMNNATRFYTGIQDAFIDPIVISYYGTIFHKVNAIILRLDAYSVDEPMDDMRLVFDRRLVYGALYEYDKSTYGR